MEHKRMKPSVMSGPRSGHARNKGTIDQWTVRETRKDGVDENGNTMVKLFVLYT